MGIIISSFRGCGKQYLIDEVGSNLKIADIGPFFNSMDASEYVDKVVTAVNMYDIVFMSYTFDVRSELNSRKIHFDFFFPSIDRRPEFIEDLVRDGVPMPVIGDIDRSFESIIESFKESELEYEHKHEMSGKGHYLLNDELIQRYIQECEK